MTRGWDYIPGVPAAGHISPSGYWHHGAASRCDRCDPKPDPRR
jgi:hypothetical protein